MSPGLRAFVALRTYDASTDISASFSAPLAALAERLKRF